MSQAKSLILNWNECAALAIRKSEMEYVAACILDQLPPSYPDGAKITVNVSVKPRSGADDIAALVDYIESGGNPSVKTAQTAIERRQRGQLIL